MNNERKARLLMCAILAIGVIALVLCGAVYLMIRGRTAHINEIKSECESKTCDIGQPTVVWGRHHSVCICAGVPR